jgi:hypothetical protein
MPTLAIFSSGICVNRVNRQKTKVLQYESENGQVHDARRRIAAVAPDIQLWVSAQNTLTCFVAIGSRLEEFCRFTTGDESTGILARDRGQFLATALDVHQKITKHGNCGRSRYFFTMFLDGITGNNRCEAIFPPVYTVFVPEL